MTTQPDPDLRTALHRIADSGAPLPVGDDLWQRGRAARRRGQVLAVAAVLVVLVSVGGLATLMTTTDREARTASTEVVPGGAIPSRIEDIPPDLELTADLAVGRGSVAFISATQDPVVTTATDGVPHRLTLVGWSVGDQGLALSPSGLRLAWSAKDADGGQATIGVLELTTGETTIYDVPQDSIRLRELTWSPDSVWLAWIADTSRGSFVGRLRTGSTPLARSWLVRGNIPDVAVNDDARLVVSEADGGLFRLQGGDEPVRLSDADFVGAGRWSPDGKHIALRSGPGTASYTLDTATNEVLEHTFPQDTLSRQTAIFPLGWVDDRVQVLLASSWDGVSELVVTTPEVDETSTWRRSVGSVAPGIADTVSLAVDLIPDLDGTSSQQLTHDFAVPRKRDISWMIGLSVAAAIAVLLGLYWRRDSADTVLSNDRDAAWVLDLGVAAAMAVLMGLRWLWRRIT